MKPQTKLLRTSRWIDQQKPICRRWTPQGMETDSVLYARLCMLQSQIGRLLVALDAEKQRRYNYE